MTTTPSRHRPTRAILGDDVVLPLPALERDQRDVVASCANVLIGRDEAIVQRRKQRRRRNRMAQVIVQEVAQPARRLQLRHVGVQVQPVDAANRQGHVVADKLVDVGHQRLLWRGSRPMLLHAEYADVDSSAPTLYSQ